MSSDPEIIQLQADIQQLQEQITSLENEMDNLAEQTDSFNSSLGKSKTLLGGAYESIVNMRKEFIAFTVNTNDQYKYAEKLAESSKETARNIGLSVHRSHEFTKEFNRATAQLLKFGGTASDVKLIMGKFAEESGRVRLLSGDEVFQIGLLEQGLGVGIENATKLYERMDLLGVRFEDVSKYVNEMVVNSQKLGLNASMVAKTLSNNFDRMATYSFKNGVQGMTKMAQLAVKMRMDVSDMLSMSEKFYEPEAAIEAAANLQMLGGDIAQAFGDPFETMYLARNKPEELAEKVGDMVENMMQFNAETGEYEFPAEARMQLKAAGTQLGINTDKMIEMARQASKIKDIKMKVSSNIGDEDMREGLANLARLNKDNKWVIDFGDDEIALEDIGMNEALEVLNAPKDSDEAIMDMAHNTMTTNEILKNILEAMKTGFVAESNVYEITEDILRPGMESLMEGTQEQVRNALEYLKSTSYGDTRTLMVEQAEALGLSTGKGVSKIFSDGFILGLKEAFGKVDWESVFDTNINTILNKTVEIGGEDVEKLNAEREEDFILRSSGQVTSFTNEDDIIGAKKGGPLDKLMDKGLPNNYMAGGATNSKMEFGNLNISGRIEIISPDGSATNMDMSSLKPQIEKMVINKLNNSTIGGTESSKNRIDTLGYG